MKVNLDGVEAWKGGGLLPPGTHHVEITDANEKTSTGGNPQVEVELRAVGGEYDGGQIRDWLTLTAEAMGRVRQFLEAVRYEIPAGEFEMPTDKLVGLQCRIVVREELYNGETKTKVKAYEPADESDVRAPAGAGEKDGSLPF